MCRFPRGAFQRTQYRPCHAPQFREYRQRQIHRECFPSEQSLTEFFLADYLRLLNGCDRRRVSSADTDTAVIEKLRTLQIRQVQSIKYAYSFSSSSFQICVPDSTGKSRVFAGLVLIPDRYPLADECQCRSLQQRQEYADFKLCRFFFILLDFRSHFSDFVEIAPDFFCGFFAFKQRLNLFVSDPKNSS